MQDPLDCDFELLRVQFPSIAKALMLLRGYPEAATYVTKLLSDTRDGERHGFPSEVLTALLNIQEAHQSLVKENVTDTNPWGGNRSIFR